MRRRRFAVRQRSYPELRADPGRAHRQQPDVPNPLREASRHQTPIRVGREARATERPYAKARDSQYLLAERRDAIQGLSKGTASATTSGPVVGGEVGRARTLATAASWERAVVTPAARSRPSRCWATSPTIPSPTWSAAEEAGSSRVNLIQQQGQHGAVADGVDCGQAELVVGGGLRREGTQSRHPLRVDRRRGTGPGPGMHGDGAGVGRAAAPDTAAPVRPTSCGSPLTPPILRFIEPGNRGAVASGGFRRARSSHVVIASGPRSRADRPAVRRKQQPPALGQLEEAESQWSGWLAAVAPEHRASAQNLVHYWAMRQRDLRGLQIRLAAYGLSSLGRSEPPVEATPVGDPIGDLGHARRRLASRPNLDLRASTRATNCCSVEPTNSSDQRRSVAHPDHGELPSAAATDPDVVADLIKRGRNIARINSHTTMPEHGRHGAPCQAGGRSPVRLA